MAPGKRKRSERASVDGGENRPSPHRPGSTNLGQHDRGSDMRNGGRRLSRGGQGGGRGGRRNDDRNNTNQLTVSARATPTPGPMSPPAKPPIAVQTPTATHEAISSNVKREIAPFDYAYITETYLTSWDTTGREHVVKAGVQARQDGNIMDLATIYQEIIRASLDDRIETSEGGSCIKDILGPEDSSDYPAAQTLFLDSFSMVLDSEELPLNPASRPFVTSTGISAIAMRHILDGHHLQNLNLTRDTFTRVGIRQATILLYRQSNYNLLREESEGYSKLATELFTSSGGNSAATDQATSAHVEASFQRVKGLIGTFDLDVGRVLDITLDVFASLLIKQYRFFVKLLRVSSWWPRHDLHTGGVQFEGLPTWALPGDDSLQDQQAVPSVEKFEKDKAFWTRAREVGLSAFFELGGRQVVDADSKTRILKERGEFDDELDGDRKWIEETGTYPPSGNRTAAQLLGFKLRYYASAARNKDNSLPANLMYLAALLIKIGFISLRDLYPHLWPSDDDMGSVKEAKERELALKNKNNRQGGGTNALMTAGALADDTIPSAGRTREATATKAEEATTTSNEAENKDKLQEPIDQKVSLLVNLLTIGAIPEALFILGRFPWIPDLFPDVIPLINRILVHSIKDVYNLTHPNAPQSSNCLHKKHVDPDQSGMPKGVVRLLQGVQKALLRWPYPDRYDVWETTGYKFYWEDWADIIPVCQNVDDVFTLCGTLLNHSGVNIGRDPSLLSKLARIGVMSLTQDNSPHNLDRWQDLLKRLLVPALSLTKSNTSVVNEVYDMLRFYPASIRYAIYAEWYEGRISRLPAMKQAFDRTKLDTQATMKRISKTNLTAMARMLAKTAYASPGIVFGVALSQIEAYNNLTEVVVECAKYFTDLGYDVLVWSLMSSLGGKDRNRNNAEFALLPSRWLLALSRFAGKVFKRYSIMNLSPIIQYINNSLYQGNSTDLVILKELISQMAGVVPNTDFTDAQLSAMTGGEALQRHTLINLQDKRYESTKTAKRLIKSLTETKLAGQLLLAIAQYRQSAIYAVADSDAHIKLLATMIDNAQAIFFQYLDLLRSNLDVKDFDHHVPGIAELMTDFGLEPALAFTIGRASITRRITQASSQAVKGAGQSLSETTPKVDAEGDVEIKDAPNVENKLEDTVKGELLVKESSSSISPPNQNVNRVNDVYHTIMEPLMTSVTALLPDSTWSAMSPDFYVTFWTSTMSNLNRPDILYDTEIKKIQEQERLVMSDRSDMSRSGMAKKEEQRKRLAETREGILAEMHREAKVYAEGRTRLLKRKSGWFHPTLKADIVSDELLEKCLIPRLLLSPTDADFSFRMIKFLHDNGVPNFRTLSLYGRIFRSHRLRSMIFTCSVREAENLARFLKSTLTDLQKWHQDATTYEEQAWGKRKSLTGFAKALEADGTPKALLDYDAEFGFKNVLFQWHKNLNTALRECLEGTEWMHIRNAITVLKTVGDVFPAIDFMGTAFIKQLETITAREKDVREDLSLTGNAVLVQLKQRTKQWVMVQAFGHHPSKPSPMNGSTQRSSSQSRTSTPRTILKPTALEFQPKSRASSIGASAAKPGEVEDGEVDDTKTVSSSIITPRSAPDSKAVVPATPALAPQRSEILIRREQIQKENAAKALAASQSHSGPPPRPDYQRAPASSAPPDRGPPNRGPPNLPSRPDAPFPTQQQLDRHRHPDRRDSWDSRLPETGRIERSGDRIRDLPGPIRRDQSLREFSRPIDRGPGPERDRDRGRPDPPPRWTAESSRQNVERDLNETHSTDNAGRLSRDGVMPPPRSSGLQGDRGPPINPDRLPNINPERQELVNPERAALISSSDPRSESPRRRDDQRERPSPRTMSPRRHASDRDFPESRRDERFTRGPHSENNTPSRGRIEDVLSTPSGPRIDRALERLPERNDRSPFQPTPHSRSVDPDHGRLNAGSRQQGVDPNFGRLNPVPASDIPSGPRDRHGRGNRAPAGNGPRGDIRAPPEQQIPRPPTPDKPPPTGPSNRLSTRSASGQFDNILSQASSAPATPTAGPTASGVHPERLKHLDPQAQAQALPPLIQHERPNRIGGDGTAIPPLATTNQAGSHHSRPSVPSLNTAGNPPLGPKGSQSSPIASGSNGLAPPTGPASAQERARGGRRQLVGINNTLQQAVQQNGPINVRGRGRVSGGGQQESPIFAPPNQIPPLLPGKPPNRTMPRDNGRDMVNPERLDLFTNNETPNEDKDKDRGSRRERSGRHSRRGSRSPDRTRDFKRGPVEDDRPSRSDHRERRGERDADRERHSGRSPHHTQLTAREPGGSSRESGREGHRERESGRRDGKERDTPDDAPWGGERGPERNAGGRSRDNRGGEERLGGGRGGDERRGGGRDSHGNRGDDSGRKRRGEETGLDSRGHDKRPRRL
ncbi:transcription factor/nuclear export subunit protein 2-domain-containing protein [Amylocarpus encephaloides]|uniref:THO complex subunit 2 n=1 Tax=Amylocarpus encephaloides TaxID=45428 RepID=A0A9P8C272_9HELO|nr:transcription factor/nuclear export subunit protein 2-domain-containing protein [Amylocarpus encephaloides]